ncbi:hypothetical protein [Burkholderia ubonensis]|nr:hypothetical protein [Burkholderia ubonensis]
MRARVKSLLAAAVMLVSGTACTPDGYTDSPAMGAFFQQLVPDASKDGVEQVSVCSYDDKWYASIYFADRMLYHYQLERDLQSVKLESSSTAAQRKIDIERGHNLDLECIGFEDGFGFNSFKARGSYRFELGRSYVNGNVRKSIVVNYPFDDTVKQRLKGAALAVQQAVNDHKKFVPVEATWGLKP